MKIDVVILAAGKGTRMYSGIPKVLHSIGGKPMAQHVIDAASLLGDVAMHVVVGHEAELVKASLNGVDSFVEQTEQLGTGHAVAQALPVLREGAITLILYGDVPLIQTGTLETLIDLVNESTMAMLTICMDNPTGYGRIVREDDEVKAIVEQKDANDEQLQIKEINTGIMCIHQKHLSKWLPALSNDNAQQEYYLTDVVAMAVKDNIAIKTAEPQNEYEVEGVNNKLQLGALERVYQRKRAEQLQIAGATVADVNRLDIRGSVIVGKDVFIDVNVVLTGDVEIGDNVSIGPNCVIHESIIDTGAQIHANCVLDQAHVGNDANVGPFARLRPNALLKAKSKVGNFVEVKNATMEAGSKVNHLTYIGDANIGANSNIGAGTITCNYDGANKHRTELGENVFIGSNSTLVAPLTIANNGFVGAGSVITQNVQEETLAVGRSKQKNIEGWKRPTKK